MDQVKLFVVSHDPRQLDEIKNRDSITLINLSALDLDKRISGNELAENRLFLARIDYEAAQVIGCVSARWEERFPKYPTLQNLPERISQLKGGEVLAPQGLVLTNSEFVKWVRNQDAVHPGMSAVMMDVIEFMKIDVSLRIQRRIVMGNNFVCSKDLFNDFLQFWREGFNYIDSKYGFEIPFTYRCPKCGLVDEEAIWRWTKARHPAFFYERLTAIFFASRPDVSLLKIQNDRLVERKSSLQSKAMFGGPEVYKAINAPSRFFKSCTHAYKSLGKN